MFPYPLRPPGTPAVSAFLIVGVAGLEISSHTSCYSGGSEAQRVEFTYRRSNRSVNGKKYVMWSQERKKEVDL